MTGVQVDSYTGTSRDVMKQRTSIKKTQTRQNLCEHKESWPAENQWENAVLYREALCFHVRYRAEQLTHAGILELHVETYPRKRPNAMMHYCNAATRTLPNQLSTSNETA